MLIDCLTCDLRALTMYGEELVLVFLSHSPHWRILQEAK